LLYRLSYVGERREDYSQSSPVQDENARVEASDTGLLLGDAGGQVKEGVRDAPGIGERDGSGSGR
jgi:hypothetical protein